MNGNGDIFKEIKQLRKCKMKTATSIDGISDDIPGHFIQIYSKLYSEVNYITICIGYSNTLNTV